MSAAEYLIIGFVAWNLIMLAAYFFSRDEDWFSSWSTGFLCTPLIMAPPAFFLLMDGKLTAGESLGLFGVAVATSLVLLSARIRWTQPMLGTYQDVLGVMIINLRASALVNEEGRVLLRNQLDQLLARRRRAFVLDLTSFRHAAIGDVLPLVAFAEQRVEDYGGQLVVVGGDRSLRLYLRLMPDLRSPSFFKERQRAMEMLLGHRPGAEMMGMQMAIEAA